MNPIHLLNNKTHGKILEHLKLAGDAHPHQLSEIHGICRQQISNALTDLNEVGMVRFKQKNEVPPTRIYEITNYGWNAIHEYSLLTREELRVLRGKTFLIILNTLKKEVSTPTEMCKIAKVTISDISHHLAILKKQHYVNYKRDGKKKHYFLTARGDHLLTKYNKIWLKK